MSYFNNFPIIFYDPKNKNNKQKSINLTVRFKLLEKIKENSTIYYDYSIKDHDRPDIIASKYYGNATLDWVILIVNNIYDINYDWPLNINKFKNFIIDKYGSVESAQNTTHHYEKIIQAESTTSLGEKIPERVLEVDLNTYLNTSVSLRKKISNYDYEFNLNETKRNIKILDRNYLNQLLEEFETIFD